MRLKGQMIYVPETDLVLFLCSPSVLNLDDLNRRGLYLSDIPLHDATRDLILLSEQFEAEYKLTKNLEILTDKLQQTYRELEDEKRKTDRLVCHTFIVFPVFFGFNYLKFIKNLNALKTISFHCLITWIFFSCLFVTSPSGKKFLDCFIPYCHHRWPTSFAINVQYQLKNTNALHCYSAV